MDYQTNGCSKEVASAPVTQRQADAALLRKFAAYDGPLQICEAMKRAADILDPPPPPVITEQALTYKVQAESNWEMQYHTIDAAKAELKRRARQHPGVRYTLWAEVHTGYVAAQEKS